MQYGHANLLDQARVVGQSNDEHTRCARKKSALIDHALHTAQLSFSALEPVQQLGIHLLVLDGDDGAKQCIPGHQQSGSFGLFIKGNNTIAPGILGLVERLVGAAQQGVNVAVAWR